MKSKHIVTGLAGLALGLFAALAPAQEGFPNKPIRLIVGYAAGGGNDIIARVVAGKMSEGFGQQVIIENKPGAQSIIAAEMVAKAAPDGYTILMGPSGPITMNPATYSKLSYAPMRDFVPLSMIGSFPLILVTNANSPIKSVKELIDFAKANPGKTNYAASAAPFQLAAELLKPKTGTDFPYIPSKGRTEPANPGLGGEIPMTIADPPPIPGPLKAGRLRALAVTSAKRHPSWPDVPTMMEAGIPDTDIVIWTGFLAPAGTPPAIVKRLQDEVARVVRLPEIRERLNGMGVDPVGNTSEEFGRIIAADIAKWTAVAKAANIKAD